MLALAAAILTWLVVSRSFGAFLADAAPQAALWLDPRQPQALTNVADRALITAAASRMSAATDQASAPPEDSSTTLHAAGEAAKDAKNFDRAFAAFEAIGRDQSMSRPLAPDNEPAVRTWATTALMNDPLNARALRILGQLAEADSNDADALKFMRAAERLSLHENIATYWLMRNSAEAGNYKAAVYYADVLLRTDPASETYTVPILAQISDDKDGAGFVKAALAGNPPWRARFFLQLPASVRDARTPLDLLLALRTDAAPPTMDEINPYLNFLINHNLYGLAYYTWLQFLPPEELRHTGLLFNGDFTGALSGLPFDWSITQGAGVTIDVVPRPDQSGGHALLVDFEFGRVDYHSVTELVMLAPGTYQFNGEYKGSLLGPRGMKWRVVCANNGTLTSGGESPMIMGTTSDWTNVAFSFTVPATGCPAQYVRLDLDARMASETLVSGSILFDNLQISRTANPPTSGG
jgi:tetratricopeptide (TPR) repeat protein